jgi:hypothetical protein
MTAARWVNRPRGARAEIMTSRIWPAVACAFLLGAIAIPMSKPHRGRRLGRIKPRR